MMTCLVHLSLSACVFRDDEFSGDQVFGRTQTAADRRGTMTLALDAEAALRRLQTAMRQPPRQGRARMTRALPPELQTEDGQAISLLEDAFKAFEQAKAVLLADVRFEHLAKEVDDVVWRFAAQAFTNRKEDHLPAFVEQHQRDPVVTTCYIPVEYLKVQAQTEALGISLLPITHERLPSPGFGFTLVSPVGSVAAVGVTGTNYGWMATRARDLAEHALRLMRVALRASMGIHDLQLRFRLGHSYAFAEEHRGWEQGPEAAYELEYGGDLIDLVSGQIVGQLPIEPQNRLQRKAILATRWIERAMFATEPLVALLYLFFALEALLGDKSEGLKAHALAFRRAMLGVATGAGFVHPSETFLLYDKVRSAAVHGEDAPAVSWDQVRSFAWDVRQALNAYLEYARAEKFTKQSQLVHALDSHADRPRLIAWLRSNGGSDWTTFLDGIEATAPADPLL